VPITEFPGDIIDTFFSKKGTIIKRAGVRTPTLDPPLKTAQRLLKQYVVLSVLNYY